MAFRPCLAFYLLSSLLPASLLPALTSWHLSALAPTEAEKTAQIREAGLEMELHQRRVAATTERHRAEQFSLAVVEVSLHYPAELPPPWTSPLLDRSASTLINYSIRPGATLWNCLRGGFPLHLLPPG